LLANIWIIIIVVISMCVGGALGFVLKHKISREKVESAKTFSTRIIDEAKKRQKT